MQFETALMTLINHPEYNSTLILRTEIISDKDTLHDSLESPDCVPSLLNHTPIRNIHRRLLPRRPGRDGSLEQDCTLYASHSAPAPQPTVLVLTPRLSQTGSLPYYHPAVVHVAFRHISADNGYDSDSHHLIIEVVPLDKTTPIDLSSRIYRTCLSLLEALNRYGWGILNNYQKRVTHDVLVPRNTYQDLYILLKERHKSLVDHWHEATDPLKHVFEVICDLCTFSTNTNSLLLQDIGIATFLMLLWKNTYTPEDVPKSQSQNSSEERPWDVWPRPPGGFVDIGCVSSYPYT